MKLSTTFSMLLVTVLALSTLPMLVNGQIRRRNGHARILHHIVLDSQERVLDESLMDETEWVDFPMDLSLSLSLSMSMSSQKGDAKGPKGDSGQEPIVAGEESIPEVPSDGVVDHKVLMKRSYVEDAHGATKLVKA